MKLPITATKAHQGKALEVDCQGETITLVGPRGEKLGGAPWASVIDHILSIQEEAQRPESRNDPRVTLETRVRYSTADGKQFEGRATGITASGLFIETPQPFSVGTIIMVEFAIPQRPSKWQTASGMVAWVCPISDQYAFAPGMGVRFCYTPRSTQEGT